ncbi:MAG TPA: N-acetyltransferase [Clostridiaceae bacterium]|nr:N-acetyltransferase [Clostridiaceae bacterium]
MELKQGENRLFLLTEEGIEAGEIIYEVSEDRLFIIKHTYTHDGFTGQGVGKKLLHGMVEKAREEGKKIRPVCEFAEAVLKKKEDYHDVLEK